MHTPILNALEEWPGHAIDLPNASPWAPDESLAVISYEELLPPDYAPRDNVLILTPESGASREVSDLLHVGRDAGIVFRGWSSNSTLRFTVGGRPRELPMSAVRE